MPELALQTQKNPKNKGHVCVFMKCQGHCDVRGAEGQMTLAKQARTLALAIADVFHYKNAECTLFPLKGLWPVGSVEFGAQTSLRKELLSGLLIRASLGKPVYGWFYQKRSWGVTP